MSAAKGALTQLPCLRRALPASSLVWLHVTLTSLRGESRVEKAESGAGGGTPDVDNEHRSLGIHPGSLEIHPGSLSILPGFLGIHPGFLGCRGSGSPAAAHGSRVWAW